MRFKILAAIYILVLAVIIYLANGRETAKLLGFIRALPYGDKIGHLLLMGFLSFLVNLALQARTVKIWRFEVPLGILIVSAVVLIEECTQAFIPTRTFDLSDLTADFVGIVGFGLFACWLVWRKRAKI